MTRQRLAVIFMHVPNRCYHTILKVKVIVTMKQMLFGILGIKIKSESLVIWFLYCINPWTREFEGLSVPLYDHSSVRSVRVCDVT